MKAQILKLAKCKTEAEFYKKYPSEEAFMKVHGKAFKKAQIGAVMSGGTSNSPKPINYSDLYNQADYNLTGQTDKMRQDAAYKQASLAAQQKQENSSSSGDILGTIAKVAPMIGSAREGAFIPQAQNGTTQDQYFTSGEGLPFTHDLTDKPVYSDYPDWQNTNGLPNTKALINPASINSGKGNVPLLKTIGKYAGPVSAKKGGKIPKADGGGNVDMNPTTSSSSSILDTIGKYADPIGKVAGGIKALKAEDDVRRMADQSQQVSALALQASAVRPQQTERKYARPEDIVNKGEAFFPVYGTGTNPLARNGIMLQDGGPVGGNPTEIQNTYAPNDIYTNGGYEPLSDSEIVKQYRAGGLIPKAATGFGDFMGSYGSPISQGISAISGPNAGGNIGGTIGETLGSFVPIPGAKEAGKIVGQLAGTLLDTNPKKTERLNKQNQQNLAGIVGNQMGKGIQQQYSSFVKDGGNIPSYEEGGWMNPEYNPQVIAKFGEHQLSDLLAPDKTMDTLRAGGHLKSYTEPSEQALQTYAMGGELQTHWGGYAEPISHNPYLPDGGETVMFKGKSHEEYSPNGQTGIGVTYGKNPVEVERGEPAVKLQDGGSPEDNSLIVYGNLQIPKFGADMLNDPKASGKKFKNYVADLSKQELKHTSALDKSMETLADFNVHTPFDRFKFNALTATVDGSKTSLKDIAEKKQNAAHLQQAINDTATEHRLVAEDLAKGKITIDKDAEKQYSKFGGKFESAKEGASTSKNQFGIIGKDFMEDPRLLKSLTAPTIDTPAPLAYNVTGDSNLPLMDVSGNLVTGQSMQQQNSLLPKLSDVLSTTSSTATDTTKSPWWTGYANQLLQYARPTYKIPKPDVTPEMLAAGMNQLQPVAAQTFQPQFASPYNISLGDQLAQIHASFAGAKRAVANNPAALAQIAAQESEASNKVLGEQFRINQGQAAQTYEKNINLANEAKLKNLALYDQQYTRQAEAASKTKQQTLNIAQSISDKLARAKQEQTLANIESKRTNYYVDPNTGVATYMGPEAQFNMYGSGQGAYGQQYDAAHHPQVPILDRNGRVVGYKLENVDPRTGQKIAPEYLPGQGPRAYGKNGAKLKARNGSIVNASKNPLKSL